MAIRSDFLALKVVCPPLNDGDWGQVHERDGVFLDAGEEAFRDFKFDAHVGDCTGV
ncbi:MAG: hypothetical protein WAW42_10150 [Candidatus Competibacteraceae bacterium]